MSLRSLRAEVEKLQREARERGEPEWPGIVVCYHVSEAGGREPGIYRDCPGTQVVFDGDGPVIPDGFLGPHSLLVILSHEEVKDPKEMPDDTAEAA